MQERVFNEWLTKTKAIEEIKYAIEERRKEVNVEPLAAQLVYDLPRAFMDAKVKLKSSTKIGKASSGMKLFRAAYEIGYY